MSDFTKTIMGIVVAFGILWGAINTISALVIWNVEHTNSMVAQCVMSGKDYGDCYNVIKLRIVPNF